MKKFYKFNGYHFECERCGSELDTYENEPHTNTCAVEHLEDAGMIRVACLKCTNSFIEDESKAEIDYE